MALVAELDHEDLWMELKKKTEQPMTGSTGCPHIKTAVRTFHRVTVPVAAFKNISVDTIENAKRMFVKEWQGRFFSKDFTETRKMGCGDGISFCRIETSIRLSAARAHTHQRVYSHSNAYVDLQESICYKNENTILFCIKIRLLRLSVINKVSILIINLV